jgi:hypothetical protein
MGLFESSSMMHFFHAQAAIMTTVPIKTNAVAQVETEYARPVVPASWRNRCVRVPQSWKQ